MRSFLRAWKSYSVQTGRNWQQGAAQADLMVGIILMVVAAVVGVRLLTPVITALVSAEDITGLDSSAASLLPVAQLVAVVVLGIGVLAGGLYFIFRAARTGF